MVQTSCAMNANTINEIKLKFMIEKVNFDLNQMAIDEILLDIIELN